MIDPQVSALLAVVAGEFDKSARNCMAASIWLATNYNPGFSACAKKEAKERWCFSEKIYEYVYTHGGIVKSIPATPAIPCDGQGWSIDAVFSMIKSSDDRVSSVTSNALGQVKEQGVINFLGDIQNDFWKDMNEIRGIISQSKEDVMTNILISEKYPDAGR